MKKYFAKVDLNVYQVTMMPVNKGGLLKELGKERWLLIRQSVVYHTE